MTSLAVKIKPAKGFSGFAHGLLTLIFPAILFVLVRIEFVPLAIILVLISKWRMFAVRPRYWLTHIRANGVDLIVGLSAVIFISHSPSTNWQLIWAGSYAIWLLFIKPGSSVLKIAIQAGVAEAAGLMAVYTLWSGSSLMVLVLLTWLVCYISARHFTTAFDEQYSSLYAHTWGYLSAALTWVLAHWLLFYGFVPQPVLLLSVLGYSLATIYYLEHTDRLSLFLRRQFIFIMCALVTTILLFSDWGDKSVGR